MPETIAIESALAPRELLDRLGSAPVGIAAGSRIELVAKLTRGEFWTEAVLFLIMVAVWAVPQILSGNILFPLIGLAMMIVPSQRHSRGNAHASSRSAVRSSSISLPNMSNAEHRMSSGDSSVAGEDVTRECLPNAQASRPMRVSPLRDWFGCQQFLNPRAIMDWVGGHAN